MANLQDTDINDSGFLQLPSFSSGNRPSSPQQGDAIFNTTLETVEIYDGSNWISVLGRPGSSPASAFSLLSEVQGFYTGVQTLYTTLNNKISPMPIRVDFETPGGPWIQHRCEMPSNYALTANGNDEKGSIAGAGNSGDGCFKDFSDSQNFDISVIPNNNGTQSRIHALLGFNTDDGPVAGQQVEGSDNFGPEEPVFYRNPATSDRYSPRQQFALYETQYELSPHTPIIGWDADSDFGAGSVNWLSKGGTVSNGHFMITGIETTGSVNDTSNYGNTSADWQKMQYRFGGEQTCYLNIWTNDSWTETDNGYSGTDTMSGGTPSGLEYGVNGSRGGPLNANQPGAALFPKAMQSWTGSGGGCGWGYYPSEYVASRGNGNHKYVFLTKDNSV